MTHRTKAARRARLDLLRLEDRTVPAVTASLVNGLLTVYGDGASNDIRLNLTNGQYAIGGGVFNASSVRAITVDAGDGDDTVVVGPEVNTPVLMFGGNGSDMLVGGSGNDEIYGGMGNDTLNGGGGSNLLYGGYGTDAFANTKSTDSVNQGSPSRTGTLGQMEQEILALVNQQRALNGLPALTYSPQLTYAAQVHSADMAAMGSMLHSLDGAAQPRLTDRADYAGYEFTALGENIAYGYNSAASVMNAWMNSPGHRANILQSMFTQVGISVKAAPNGVLYFTQEFGSPAPGASNVSSGGSTPLPSPTPATAPTPTPTPAPPPIQPAAHLYAVGTRAGTAATVVAYDAATGRQVFSVQPFGGFAGGVKVATGDVNGDGYDDLLVGAGAGGGPAIKVYNGKTGTVIRDFFAYSAAFHGGVNVSLGDVDGDGKADIVVGAGAGGGPHVQVFSGADNHVIYSFFAYWSGFTGGVSVAAGDVNGDGRADIVTGTGVGGGPHVKAFDGRSLSEFRSFFAYDAKFQGGVNVAAGDVNGDGKADIVVGAGAGGGPHVQVFSGSDNRVLDSFFAFNGGFAGGVQIGTADVNSDGVADIVVGGGAGRTAEVKCIECGTHTLLRDFTAFATSFLGGVYVG